MVIYNGKAYHNHRYSDTHYDLELIGDEATPGEFLEKHIAEGNKAITSHIVSFTKDYDMFNGIFHATLSDITDRDIPEQIKAMIYKLRYESIDPLEYISDPSNVRIYAGQDGIFENTRHVQAITAYNLLSEISENGGLLTDIKPSDTIDAGPFLTSMSTYLRASVMFTKNMEKHSAATQYIKDIYNAEEAIAVKELVKDRIDFMTRTEKLIADTPGIKELTLQELADTIAKGHERPCLSRTEYKDIDDIPSRLEQDLPWPGSKTYKAGRRLILRLAEAAADILTIPEDELEEAIRKLAYNRGTDAERLLGTFHDIKANLLSVKDRPLSAVVSHILKKELDNFDRIHPEEMVTDRDADGNLVCTGIQMKNGFIDASYRIPSVIHKDISGQELLRNLKYRSYPISAFLLADAAGLECIDGVLDKLPEIGLKKCLALSERFGILDSSITDHGITPDYEDKKTYLMDYTDGKDREIADRLVKMLPEDFHMLDQDGITNRTVQSKIILGLPLDSKGRPRINNTMIRFLHEISLSLFDSGKIPLDHISKYPHLMRLSDAGRFDTSRSIIKFMQNAPAHNGYLASFDAFAADLIDTTTGNNSPEKDLAEAAEIFNKGVEIYEHTPAGTDRMELPLTEEAEKTLKFLSKDMLDIGRLQGMLDGGFEFTVPQKKKLEEKIRMISDEYEELKDSFDRTISENICRYEAREKIKPYMSMPEKHLAGLFKEKYNFAPRIIPLLSTVCREGLSNDHKKLEPLRILSPDRIVSDFSRHRISQIKDYASPAMVLLALECPMEKLTEPVRDIIYANADAGSVSAMIDNFDIFTSKKQWNLEMLKNIVKDISVFDRESLMKLKDMTPREYRAVTEMQRAKADILAYEHDYGYDFRNNRVLIPGKDVMAEDKKRHLKAYILAPDDYRNITVGYDTTCCQHYGDAGEDCTAVATMNPNSGIWVIENDRTGKIEAQAWVYSDRARNTFVFDNIEFSNDQKVESYHDILGAYINALPQKNVHMGMGYNAMTDIGDTMHSPKEGGKDIYAGAPRYYACGTQQEPYSDYDRETARVLKRDGEMLMGYSDAIQVDRDAVIEAHIPEYEILKGTVVPAEEAERAGDILRLYKDDTRKLITDRDGNIKDYRDDIADSEDIYDEYEECDYDYYDDCCDEEPSPYDTYAGRAAHVNDFSITTEDAMTYRCSISPEERPDGTHVVVCFECPAHIRQEGISSVSYDVTAEKAEFNSSGHRDHETGQALKDYIETNLKDPDAVNIFPDEEKTLELSEETDIIVDGLSPDNDDILSREENDSLETDDIILPGE